MLLLTNILVAQFFLELPVFSTFYPSRTNFFETRAIDLKGMYIDYSILIGSQKGLNVSRLSPNVIFSDFVLGFEYFLETIRLLETDFFNIPQNL